MPSKSPRRAVSPHIPPNASIALANRMAKIQKRADAGLAFTAVHDCSLDLATMANTVDPCGWSRKVRSDVRAPATRKTPSPELPMFDDLGETSDASSRFGRVFNVSVSVSTSRGW